MVEDRQKIVLVALLCKESNLEFVKRMSFVLKELSGSFFFGKSRTLYSMLSKYFVLTGSLLSKSELLLMLKDSGIGVDVIYEYDKLFDELGS